MQQLHARHFLAALGYFDAIPDQDPPPIDAQRLREQAQHRLCPQPREAIELHGTAMKAVEQLVVEASP